MYVVVWIDQHVPDLTCGVDKLFLLHCYLPLKELTDYLPLLQALDDTLACPFIWFSSTSSTSPLCFLLLIPHIRKGMELLNLDSNTFIQNCYLIITGYNVHKWATVHFCIPSPAHVLHVYIHLCLYMCVCLCLQLVSEGVWMSVRAHSCSCPPPCQSCSFVSRVDVPKWGHFLSVWCLRNNPTAQKLLQPSASTYLSL